MKYKQGPTPDTFYQISGDTKQSFSKNSKEMTAGYFMYQEMQKWIAAGNEIEPFETAEEIMVREAESKKDALLMQETELLGLITSNAYHITEHRPETERLFSADYGTWLTKIKIWDQQRLEVKTQIELMNQGKEFTLIEISPVPIFE
jgi:hypothetical protein